MGEGACGEEEHLHTKWLEVIQKQSLLISSQVVCQFHCHRIRWEQCQEAESLTQSGLQ